ncbi:hypothetical protein [Streptodolium elevatio]|uniref:Uncharacterized protein n=1 Tax=Streptodolium elevatio TaxID=3157996 RepID=A0ABV3DKD6_9ACTN
MTDVGRRHAVARAVTSAAERNRLAEPAVFTVTPARGARRLPLGERESGAAGSTGAAVSA